MITEAREIMMNVGNLMTSTVIPYEVCRLAMIKRGYGWTRNSRIGYQPLDAILRVFRPRWLLRLSDGLAAHLVGGSAIIIAICLGLFALGDLIGWLFGCGPEFIYWIIEMMMVGLGLEYVSNPHKWINK